MARCPRFIAAATAFVGLYAAWSLCAPRPPQAPTSDPIPDLKDPSLIGEGERTFAASCSIPYCHGKEGTAGRAPALREKTWNTEGLRQIILKGVPNSSMLNFDDKLNERQVWAVVGYILAISGGAEAEKPSLRSESQEADRSEGAAARSPIVPAALTGEARRGEQLFFQSAADRGCAPCHAAGGRGAEVGPDLTRWKERSAREIFEAIVDPSAHIDPAYTMLSIIMKDGEKIQGLKKEETANAIRVYDLTSRPPVLRRLAKDQVQNIEKLPSSGMPANYAEVYSLMEILDLVAFLKSAVVTYREIR